LSPLEELRSFHPDGKINLDNLSFCGANVGLPLSATEARDSAKKKVLSGQFTTACEEVRSQMFWPNLLLDVSVLGDAQRPEYSNLSPAQFAAGFSALILVYLPEQLRGSVCENMLWHFNRLMNFASVTAWDNILGFNQQFTKKCEHHQMSFVSWDIIHRWHERNFSSLRLLNASRIKNPREAKNEDDKKDPNFVPESYCRTQKLCFKFQKGQCEEKESHTLGKITLVHACALCSFKKRGTVPDHGAHSCPKREKSKRKEKGF
jgi:hypothetical protein